MQVALLTYLFMIVTVLKSLESTAKIPNNPLQSKSLLSLNMNPLV